MSEKETFFLDTNIVIKWIYREILNENPAVEYFINSLSKGQCVILHINLIEFETIIYDAYNITSHVIYEKILSRQDWDKLGVEDKLGVLEDIRKNFEQIYEQILTKYYNGQILPGGIRQILAKEFFIKLEEKLLNSNLEALRNHIVLNERTQDLIDYLASTEYLIKQKCIVLDDTKILFSDNTIRQIQLIYEGINAHIRKLKSKGYNKTPSRNDQLIFVYLFLLLRGRIYDKIVFITDDNDFERMHNTVLDHLKDIINGNADPRGDFKEYAIEANDILRKLVIKGINDLITKQKG
ncbi:hypothetical protein [Acidianus ambivalens]|uniref:DUF4935 domain-containing protein n=1 Tax=Acidianus ambivalens TaxID=2283 RepID=A0A650CWE1_ACIAM|nr:hypothetical protein [Acidianus ambivalens]MQL54261.1 hypothetical protein [Acidianus ambivalens]QGR22088.1 hypothetical protein D1866_08885 [Acidianus ambivalens]